jgi:hypothetical protein
MTVRLGAERVVLIASPVPSVFNILRVGPSGSVYFVFSIIFLIVFSIVALMWQADCIQTKDENIPARYVEECFRLRSQWKSPVPVVRLVHSLLSLPYPSYPLQVCYSIVCWSVRLSISV